MDKLLGHLSAHLEVMDVLWGHFEFAVGLRDGRKDTLTCLLPIFDSVASQLKGRKSPFELLVLLLLH